MNIAVAGTGYVGLSLATLLSQKNTVTAVDIIPEKVENAFLYVNQRYDYDCDISDYTTTIEAWGNEPYSRTVTEKLLDLLSGIAQIQECSSLEFCGEDRTYWRYIFEGGRWKEQSGKLVYEDCEME